MQKEPLTNTLNGIIAGQDKLIASQGKLLVGQNRTNEKLKALLSEQREPKPSSRRTYPRDAEPASSLKLDGQHAEVAVGETTPPDRSGGRQDDRADGADDLASQRCCRDQAGRRRWCRRRPAGCCISLYFTIFSQDTARGIPALYHQIGYAACDWYPFGRCGRDHVKPLRGSYASLPAPRMTRCRLIARGRPWPQAGFRPC